MPVQHDRNLASRHWASVKALISTASGSLGEVWRGVDQRIAVGGWLAWVALAGLCLALFVPGCQSIPATDRDESRYAQASRQILESGDWVDIRFQDELRLKKPPGIYWLQAGVRQALDLPDRIGSYRLTSLLGATLAVLLFYALSRRLLDRREALWPPVLLATSFLLGAEVRLATTDAVLLLCTTLAGSVLTLRWLGRAWPRLGLPAFAAAVCVAGARVALGAHYASDVLVAIAMVFVFFGCLRLVSPECPSLDRSVRNPGFSKPAF
ncbi:MAG: phospholipid carrier-dependent glycosyltransferase [Rhodocyclaceae bacterium]|nr:phospholipid carrier-dependent glycosyltransferase [Rhodocyclaceae bacterium]